MTRKQGGYVFGYVNPDTDGVCSSIGYSFLASEEGRNFRPVIFGNTNRETNFVLRKLGVRSPSRNIKINPSAEIVVVDTHDKNQLPPNIELGNVVEIIDHHPTGTPEAFPRAKIQNEKVGSVATLIAERMKERSVVPTPKVAGCLAAAIVSNTLNFTAPSTSKRDRIIFKWLSRYKHISKQFIKEMFKERSDISGKKTVDVLMADYKEFNISNLKVGISQFETTRPQDLLSRPDLEKAVRGFEKRAHVDYFFLNVVDIILHKSVLVATNVQTQNLLNRAIGARFKECRAEFSRILLRKTDLVPKLQKWLDVHRI